MNRSYSIAALSLTLLLSGSFVHTMEQNALIGMEEALSTASDVAAITPKTVLAPVEVSAPSEKASWINKAQKGLGQAVQSVNDYTMQPARSFIAAHPNYATAAAVGATGVAAGLLYYKYGKKSPQFGPHQMPVNQVLVALEQAIDQEFTQLTNLKNGKAVAQEYIFGKNISELAAQLPSGYLTITALVEKHQKNMADVVTIFKNYKENPALDSNTLAYKDVRTTLIALENEIKGQKKPLISKKMVIGTAIAAIAGVACVKAYQEGTFGQMGNALFDSGKALVNGGISLAKSIKNADYKGMYNTAATKVGEGREKAQEFVANHPVATTATAITVVPAATIKVATSQKAATAAGKVKSAFSSAWNSVYNMVKPV